MIMTKAPVDFVLSYLEKEFPDAKCALNFGNDYECLCAILLSAQTTDKSVNRVTPMLFRDFPSPKELSSAPVEAVEKDIKSLGLYHNKARNLIELAKAIQGTFAEKIPQTQPLLMKLPGVGKKTSGVFLAERYGIPAIPVDTHVSRVACRLGYASKVMKPEDIESRLEKAFPENRWIFLHHAIILFGREICHAQNPNCGKCGLVECCPYFKKYLSTKGK
jgi:endonuclease III